MHNGTWGGGAQKYLCQLALQKCGEQINGSLSNETFKNYTHIKVQLSSILESMKLPSQLVSRTVSQWIS
jgi:hypothetical protein